MARRKAHVPDFAGTARITPGDPEAPGLTHQRRMRPRLSTRHRGICPLSRFSGAGLDARPSVPRMVATGGRSGAWMCRPHPRVPHPAPPNMTPHDSAPRRTGHALHMVKFTTSQCWAQTWKTGRGLKSRRGGQSQQALAKALWSLCTRKRTYMLTLSLVGHDPKETSNVASALVPYGDGTLRT